MHNPRMRQAELADFPRVWELYSSAVRHLARSGIDQWDARYPTAAIIEADIRSGCLHLLEDSGGIISAAVLNAHQDKEYASVPWEYTSKNIAVVHRLCVSPAYQGQGAGRLTMLNIHDLARQKGYDAIRLDAFNANAAANALYANLGYRRAGFVTFRKGLFNCYEIQLLQYFQL